MEHDLLHHNIIFFVCMKIELTKGLVSQKNIYIFFISAHPMQRNVKKM